MKYKKYPNYKDSGVEWLGEVPENWDCTHIGLLFDIKAGGDVKKEFFSEEKTNEFKYPIYTNTTVTRKVYGYSNRAFFKENTITVTGRGDIGFAVYRDHQFDAIIRLLVLSPRNKENCKYFMYYINSVLNFNEGSSAINQLSTEQIKPYRVLIPTVREQQQIASFLDNSTSKIDTLIEKQIRLIELLKEKRQAVISHAVTKGINPNVKMKDSDVEWLGEIPEHWENKKVKYLLNDKLGIKIGPFGSSLKLDDMVKNGYKVYGQENVINKNFTLGHRFISHSKFESMIVYKIEPDDILITMMGTVGNCIVVPKNIEIGIIDSHLIKIRTNKQLITSKYFVNMIDKSNLVKVQIDLFSKGSIMQGLNSSIIKSLIFPTPPINEQKQILAYLDENTSKIDKLVEKAKKSIELLKEKRTALISAAVTGKIDVREEV